MIRPLHNYIAIRKTEKEQYKGMIYLGESEDDTGEIVAVGPGKRTPKGGREPMFDVRPGDVVTFSSRGNTRVKVDDEEIVMVRRDAIIGVIQEAVA